VYYSLFQFLEQDGILDPDNPGQLWCLQYIYLPRLNRDLALFSEQWNLHGIRTVKGSPSPQTMYMERMLQLQGSSQHTAVLDFTRVEPPAVNDQEYGVDPVEPVTGEHSANLSIVDVPSVRCPFSDAVLQELTHTVDPLDNSLDIHGIGLYQITLAYLELNNAT
jgi:hypothetical protein